MEECTESTVDILPNETLLKVFRFLSAKDLIVCSSVSHRFFKLANFPLLWKKLCKSTSRITGKHTVKVCNEYANTLGKTWKSCYYWISPQDLAQVQDIQEYSEYANNQKDQLKRKYLLFRAIEIFPKNPSAFQTTADYLADRPDDGESWGNANSFYKLTLDFCTPQDKKHKALALLRFAIFLTHQDRLEDADLMYRKLLALIPGNPWVFERYAEFLSEHKHKHNMAERILRMVLNVAPSGSSLGTYAAFLWHIRRQYSMAGKFFKMCVDMDMDRIYFFMNYLGRVAKDEQLAKTALETSKLFRYVEDILQNLSSPNPADRTAEEKSEEEQAVFSLALAYHQIHCAEEAERLYRMHLKMTEKHSLYTLSNLAELLVHSKRAFQEAEQFYLEALDIAGGYNDTIEIALVGSKLAQNKDCLPDLRRLLSSSHIKCSRSASTEGWIIMYIHSPAEDKQEALTNVKKQLVTHEVRPKLILMFDANISWAKQHLGAESEWVETLCKVYNGEEEIEILDNWKEWASIVVDPPPPDEEVTDQQLSILFEDDQGEDSGTENQTTQTNDQQNDEMQDN